MIIIDFQFFEILVEEVAYRTFYSNLKKAKSNYYAHYKIYTYSRIVSTFLRVKEIAWLRVKENAWFRYEWIHHLFKRSIYKDMTIFIQLFNSFLASESFYRELEDVSNCLQ